MPPLLEVRDLVTAYGLSRVLYGVSLDVEPGEIVCLLGRNGAGADITGRPAFENARLGIGYVPDDRRIFADLTVEENLLIVRRVTRRQGRWTLDRVWELFPVLRELRRNRGSDLSGGEQKMLAIGRALMGNPVLLILDEPSEGLSPLMVRTLLGAINAIRGEGVTLLVADQNLKFARRAADRGYIIEKGTIRYTGRLEALWADEDVVRKYLAV